MKQTTTTRRAFRVFAAASSATPRCACGNCRTAKPAAPAPDYDLDAPGPISVALGCDAATGEPLSAAQMVAARAVLDDHAFAALAQRVADHDRASQSEPADPDLDGPGPLSRALGVDLMTGRRLTATT